MSRSPNLIADSPNIMVGSKDDHSPSYILILFAIVITPTVFYLVWIIHKLRGFSESVDNEIEEAEEGGLDGGELVQRLEKIRGELS